MTDQLNIKSSHYIEKVVIYNLLGKKVFSQKPQNQTIDLRFLSNGAYIVQLISKSGTSYKKMIKTHN